MGQPLIHLLKRFKIRFYHSFLCILTNGSEGEPNNNTKGN